MNPSLVKNEMERAIKTYQNNDLAHAINTFNEVMLANKCYVISVDQFNQIKDLL